MRGLTLTYETIRYWCLKFGQTYANRLRRSGPRPGDKWHLDEVFLKINGQSIICGVPWTRMGMHWTFWCKAEETRKRPRSSFANY